MRIGHTAVTLVLLVGCSGQKPNASVDPRSADAADAGDREDAEEPVNDPHYHARLLEIAHEYPAYGRKDNALRGDVEGCRDLGDRRTRATPARFSEAGQKSLHARKLYYLYVAMPDLYEFPTHDFPETHAQKLATMRAQETEIGQAIVKEAWVPKEVPPEKASELTKGGGVETTRFQVVDKKRTEKVLERHVERHWPYARLEGKLYHASEKSTLFIMYKLHRALPNTDHGWVYGTVTADGKTVTSAGMVKSCMECHKRAPYDRQFGLKLANEH